MPFQSCTLSVARPCFRESGVRVADDVYPGTKHNGTPVSTLYLLKWKTKLIVPMYFGTKMSKFCFRMISFPSVKSELSFNSEDSKIYFDQACWTTVNSPLRALRAIYNTSSDKGEEFFADQLLILGMKNWIVRGGAGKRKAVKTTPRLL